MAEVFGILVMPDEYVIKKKAEYKIDCRGETEIPLEDYSDRVQDAPKAVASCRSRA